MTVPDKNPVFRPTFDIRMLAGIAALASPIIWKVIGSVTRSALGANWVPIIPPNRTRIGAAVSPKDCATVKTIRLL